MMQQSRPERLTSFSSQSIPLQTLLDIGWWDKTIVSEDSRIFWQGFLKISQRFPRRTALLSRLDGCECGADVLGNNDKYL